MQRLVVQNATVAGGNGCVDIAISDGRIANIGKWLPVGEADTIMDARGGLVIPGMICAHMHSHDHFNKASFDNMPLEVWMLYLKPMLGGIEWTPEEHYLRTMIGAIEMVETGTTAIMDFVALRPLMDESAHQAVRQAYLDIGVHAVVGCDLSDKPYYDTIPYLKELLPDQTRSSVDNVPVHAAQEICEYIEHLMRTYNELDNGRVKFAPAPSGPQRCSDELLEQAYGLAERFDVPYLSHVLETKVQLMTAYHIYAKPMVKHLSEIGCLSSRTAVVHGVWLDAEEIRLLAENRCSVVHCPLSNLKLGSGIAPVRRMLDMGVNVALGPDNTSASDSQNMFDVMRCGALIGKLRESEYEKWVGAREMYEAATLGGARAMLAHNAGTIDVGSRADLVILDTANQNFVPRAHWINHLVYCEHGESVRTVISDGKIVKQDGVLKTVDKQQIYSRVRDLEPKIRRSQRLAASEATLFEAHVKTACKRLALETQQSKPSDV